MTKQEESLPLGYSAEADRPFPWQSHRI